MDPELADRARRGDHDAFAALAASAIGPLTAVARLILRDEEAAQDAVQESLVDAWRGIRGLRDPERAEAWLRRLLVRKCQAQTRSSSPRRVVELDLTRFDAPNDHDLVAGLATRDQLERGLRQLSIEHRAVLVVTYYLDLPVKSAADVLGIPVGTLKSRHVRALSALRATIEADERRAATARERYA
jgi:RNA polymerase sigma factor (sigma-70 family)